MARTKGAKGKKKEIKVIKVAPEVIITPKVSEKVKKVEEATKKLQDLLLTQSQLKRGGPGIRSRYAREAGYITTLEEVNQLRLEIGLPKIQGLGALRKK